MLKQFALTALGLTLAATVSARELNSIGVTVGSLGNPYFIAMAKGVTDRAKAINPNVKVTAVSAEYDLNRQFSQIDAFIASKVDFILLNASDPAAILPAVKRAQTAGIPVIALDATAAGVDATVQTDNVKAGAMACQFLSDKLGAKGKVIILNGPPVASIKDRVKGCKETLAKGQFEVLSDNQDGKTTREGGLSVGQSLMTRFPQIDGVFAVNDQEAIGADLAAKQLRRTELIIVGVDGAPDMEAALKAKSTLQASAAQDPYTMGGKAVDVGNELVSSGVKPDNGTVLMDPFLVTRENVADYKGWGSR